MAISACRRTRQGVALAQTESFAGQLTVTPEQCAWRRDLDYQPPARFPDVGGWRFTGPDTLIETGVHLPYEEVWLREPDSAGLFAAFRPEDGSGLLVIAGDHFLAIGGRAEGLPGGCARPWAAATWTPPPPSWGAPTASAGMWCMAASSGASWAPGPAGLAASGP